MHSGDLSPDVMELSFSSIEELNETEKEELQSRYPQSGFYIRFLENLVNQKSFPSSWDPRINGDP